MHESSSRDPLTDLLRFFGAGAEFTQDTLAREIGVSESLVDQMLSTLLAAGYIEAQSSACGHGCRDCPAARTCGMPGGARLWTVTERGRRYLGESQQRR